METRKLLFQLPTTYKNSAILPASRKQNTGRRGRLAIGMAREEILVLFLITGIILKSSLLCGIALYEFNFYTYAAAGTKSTSYSLCIFSLDGLPVRFLSESQPGSEHRT